MTDWYNTQTIRAWIESSDEVPDRHLPLFDSALGALLASRQTNPDDSLSQACEQWRYHLLRHDANGVCGAKKTLIELLDLAANKLGARPLRLPRRVSGAVAGSDAGLVGGQRVADWLGSATSQRELIHLATRLTNSCECRSADGATTHAGRRHVALFAPIYLSNFCVNSCPYCWFRFSEKIVRRHLSVAEVGREAEALVREGVRDVLLVAGDYPKCITAAYLADCVQELRSQGLFVRIEVAPLGTWDYKTLADAGAQGVTLYQETYDRRLYALYHPKGRKAAYDWRLETLERAADAGISRLGLGILIGLADPLHDIASLIEHGRYLATRYPAAQLAFSLPRIRSAPPGFRIMHRVDSTKLIQLYCLLRVAFPACDLVLSTRETPALRNRLVKICVTRLSAGSRTAPGTYAATDDQEQAGTQFPVADLRPVAEVRGWLLGHGYAVC